jgi:hypothetical protein
MAMNYPFSSIQIAEALSILQQSPSKKINNGFLMLRANYEADNMEISTIRLGKAAGYDNYNTANEQYGSFAHRICDELGYTPELRGDGNPIWTFVLCEESSAKDSLGHFQWKLRPQVAEALESFGLVKPIARADLLDDIAAKEDDLAKYSAKDRETIIKGRIGQGVFRTRLINFWGGCSVTGCDCLEILVASHIKPWRDCTGKEAIDPTNGLLLLPNLDRAFDRGLISFDDSGKIIFSDRLDDGLAATLGIHRDMEIRTDKIMSVHKPFLHHHREMVFLKSFC